MLWNVVFVVNPNYVHPALLYLIYRYNQIVFCVCFHRVLEY